MFFPLKNLNRYKFVLFLAGIAKPTITAVKSNNSAIEEIYQTLDNKTPT